MATVAAVIASTHHPFYYRASTSTGADRPPFADEWVAKIRRSGRRSPGPSRTSWSWWAATTSTSCGWTTCRSSWWARRRSSTRTGTTRNASSACRGCCFTGQEDLSAHILREGLDAGFDLAFSNELRIDHSVTCPIITLRPEADLPIVPDLHEHLRAADAAAEAVRAAGPDDPRRLVESWPADKRVAIIGTGHLSLELGGPRQFGPHGPDPEFDRKAVEWIANGDIGRRLGEVTLEPVRAGQRHPRLHGLHADDGRRRSRPRPTTWTPWTCSTPWRPTSPGTRGSVSARLGGALVEAWSPA